MNNALTIGAAQELPPFLPILVINGSSIFCNSSLDSTADTNPRAVFVTADTIQNDQIVDEGVKTRLETMVNSTLKLGSKI